ncbi:MAG: hypothetical protein QM479_00375 [Pseudomonadota bacterium]
MKLVTNLLLILLIFLLCIFVYHLGFNGGFLLDDFANLHKIKIFNISSGIDKYINYLGSSESGFLKRPISMLSFLIHTSDWPAEPFYFKFFNFLFHCLNGFLLYIVSKRILEIVNINSSENKRIAVFAALVWVLHPFFVSTVLYPIQRMAILPVSFILIGFIFYLQGRILLKEFKKEAFIHLLIAVYIFTTLATLSKENGILLPLLLFILEKIIIKNSNLVPLPKLYKYILFYIPIAVIFMALLIKLPGLIDGYSRRTFTLEQRLFSESRALMLYLYHFFVPQYFTEGVYTDGFLKSVSLFQPITTLFSLISIAVLLLYSLKFKNKYPLISFAIIFYFLANILESTYIPLELYFEHRAYLPTLFISLALSKVVFTLINRCKYYIVIPFLIIILLAFTTYKRANLWSNNFDLHVKTANKFPQSLRASANAANLLESEGRIDEAIKMLQYASETHNNNSILISYLNLNCNYKQAISLVDLKKLTYKLKEIPFYIEDRSSFKHLVLDVLKNKCVKNPSKMTLSLLDSLKNNSKYKEPYVYYLVEYLIGYTEIFSGNDKGYIHIKNVVENATDTPNITWSLNLVSDLFSQSKYMEAEKVLEILEPVLNSSEFNIDPYLFRKRFAIYYNYLIEIKNEKNINHHSS